MAWEIPRLEVIAAALLSGALIQISQVFYFQALSYSEAGIVSAYWNITPTILPIASFLLFGRFLQVRHYLGIITLILVSVGFCLADVNFKTRWKAFYLMSVASCIQAAALLLEEHIFRHSSFFIGFLLITIGIIISGVLPLSIRSIRLSFFKSLAMMQCSALVLFGIELLNLLALLLSQRAIALGIPALVAAVETTIPAYTFILSVVLYRFNLPLSDARVLHHFRLKLMLLGTMMAGICLVS
ncbi:MAG: hypothetical protein Kow00121_51960 [Elainellaceae cyanobacterium]